MLRKVIGDVNVRGCRRSVRLSGTSAVHGSIVMLTPETNEGYEPVSLTVRDSRGSKIAITRNADGTCSFKMPAGNGIMEATFKEKHRGITISSA